MKRDGISLDAVSYFCILKACGTIGAADKDQQLHVDITKVGLLENDLMVDTTRAD